MSDKQNEAAKCPKAERIKQWEHGARQQPHTCPYAAEIHDDRDSLCECCEECTHECAMDV